VLEITPNTRAGPQVNWDADFAGLPPVALPGGTVYRLVGFDTAERGDRALCDTERDLAEKAATRLRQLISSGEPMLKRVACACPTGTEGKQSCNFGRASSF
jgi:hypothetical protein